MRTTRALTRALAVAAACAAATSGWAQNAADAVPDDARAVMQRQEPLTRAASLIRWDVERNGYDGFMSLALGEDHVVLWWKGELPDSLQAVLKQAGAIAPVKVAPAAYSRLELKAAAGRIGAALRAQPGGPVHTVLIAVDGSGLQVGTSASPADARRSLPAVGVPVTFVQQEPMRLDSRLNDSRPWRGGARIVNQSSGGHWCSSGFGVRNGSGTEYLLTAGHCGKPGDLFSDFQSESIGRAAAEHRNHDLLLISTDAMGSMYDGGVDSSYTKSVAGWDWVYHGEWMCSSGSVSGVICDHVANLNWLVGTICGTDVWGSWECWNDLLIANRSSRATATIGGDSGGPVFTLSGPRVISKGTITGRGTFAYQMVFQDFGTAWRDFGITPLVLP